MPDRVVNYVFKGTFGNLAAGLTTMGRNVDATANKLLALDRNGQKMRAGLTQLGNTGGKVGLLFAAGVALVVRSAANFEQAMSNVQAATHETAANMDALRQAALDAGQATQYSATEAAGAIEELAKAGISTKDILDGGLSGALDLAAAGGLEVADAAQIAATALTQFKLSGEDVPHVADLLAAGAGKAQGDVTDLSMALKQSGLVASQMGVSIEETTGTLAAFASAGLLGSDAGTSFRTMLLRLANPTQESAKLMEQLGIQAYDAQGQFVGIESLSGQLQAAFKGQSQATRDAALATLFGSDAIRAANVLYTNGAQGIADWTAKVDDQGYAAETAAIKMDNLKGDIEQLGGALETAFIGAGDGSQGPLRTLVQGITAGVNAFNKLPSAAQSATTALAGVVAVTGGSLWFGAKVVGGITDAKEALEQLGVSSAKTKGLLAGVGKAATAAGLLLAGLSVVDALNPTKALPGVEELTGKLIKLTQVDTGDLPKEFDDLSHSIERLSNPNAAQGLQDKLSDAIGGIGGGSELRNARAEVEALDGALTNLVNTAGAEQATAAFDAIADSAGLSKSQIGDLKDLLPGYTDALAGAANTAQLAAGSTDDLKVAQRQAATAAEEQAAAIADTVKAMHDQVDAAVGAFDAVTQYRQAMKDATAQAKKNNEGIAGSSEAALANRSALSQLAGAWNQQSAVVTDNVKKYREARANFVQTAEAMGVPKKAAQQLANQLLALPQSKVIPVSAPGASAAVGDVRQLKTAVDALHSKTVTITVNRRGGVTSDLGGRSVAAPSADGGSVPKTGQPYADRHLYLLADGEEIISNRYGQADRFRADRSAGRIPAYADGGTTGDDRKSKQKPKGKAHAHATLFVSPELAELLDGAKGAAGALKVLEAQAKRSEKALDKARDTRDQVTDLYNSLAASVTSGLKSELFAEDKNRNPWAAGGGSSVAATNAQLEADISNAQMFAGLEQSLKDRGLSGAALQALIAKNDTGLLQQYANASQADLDRYQQLYGQRDTVAGDTGAGIAEQFYGEAQRAAEKAYQEQRDELREANRRLQDVKKAIEKAEKSNRSGHKDTADATSSASNQAFNAPRRARRRARKP